MPPSQSDNPAYAQSIQVYPTPGVPGWWNWTATWPGGGQLGRAAGETLAWDAARACIDGHTRRPFAFEHPRRP